MSAKSQDYVEENSPYDGIFYMIHLRMGILANNTHGYTIFMRDELFAHLCRCSTKTLQRARAEMVKDGYLSLISPATKKEVAKWQFIFKGVSGDGDHFDKSMEMGGQNDRSNEMGGHLGPDGWTSEETSPIYVNKSNNVATPAEIPTLSPSKPKKTYSPEVYELNNYLCQLIDQNGSRVPKGGEVEMDRLLRIDKKDPAEVRAIIEWSQNSSFWRANILSAKKLREKYDQLRLQAIAGGIHLPESFSPDVLERARAWDEFEDDFTMETPTPPFPRPQNSDGYLLDGSGKAYYIDPMQPTKRRYVEDE